MCRTETRGTQHAPLTQTDWVIHWCCDLGPINFILQLLHRTDGEAVLRRSLPELPSVPSASSDISLRWRMLPGLHLEGWNQIQLVKRLVQVPNIPGLLSGPLTTRLVVLGDLVELLHFFGTVLHVAAPFSLLAGSHALLDYFNDLLVHFTEE